MPSLGTKAWTIRGWSSIRQEQLVSMKMVPTHIKSLLTYLPGNPKPVTYTHRMMATADICAGLPDIAETHIHQFALRRWYTAVPLQHVSLALDSLGCSIYG